MQQEEQRIEEAFLELQKKTDYCPKIGVVLGSGLGDYAETLEGADSIFYQELPHFPKATVEGHKGRFLVTENLICMQGRFHYYEGCSMEEVVRPIRLMARMGVKVLLLTNACGGIRKTFQAGDFMLLRDHINLMGMNPLVGQNLDRFGCRFPDMSHAYSERLRDIAKQKADMLKISLQEGIYAAFSGPSYETPAEVKMAGILGADAVGMSTVPEAIIANHCGMEVLGISCITNLAAGVSDKPLSHQEVTETAQRVKRDFVQFLEAIIKEL